jgi:hypothetical protein
MISHNLTNQVDAPYPALVTLNPLLEPAIQMLPRKSIQPLLRLERKPDSIPASKSGRSSIFIVSAF